MQFIRGRDIVAILVLLFIIILSVYRSANPEYFLYYSEAPEHYTWNPQEPPNRICDIQGCEYVNVPLGKDNLYLKQVNPFMYSVYYYQTYINLVFIILALIISRNQIKIFINNLLKNSKGLNSK